MTTTTVAGTRFGALTVLAALVLAWPLRRAV